MQKISINLDEFKKHNDVKIQMSDDKSVLCISNYEGINPILFVKECDEYNQVKLPDAWNDKKLVIPKDVSDGMLIIEDASCKGFMNIKGEIVVPPIYDEVSEFCDGRAFVLYNCDLSIIDTKGKVLQSFHNIKSIKNCGGFYLCKLTNSKYRFIDDDYNDFALIGESFYIDAVSNSKGLAYGKIKEDLYNVIIKDNKTGKVNVKSVSASNIWIFDKAVVAYNDVQQKVYIYNSNNEKFELDNVDYCGYFDYYDENDDFIVLRFLDDYYQIYSKIMKETIQKLLWCRLLRNGNLVVDHYGEVDIFDKEFNIISSFEDVYKFDGGYTIACNKKDYFVINNNYEIVRKLHYKSYKDLNDTFFVVGIPNSEKYTIIDHKGNEVIDSSFTFECDSKGKIVYDGFVYEIEKYSASKMVDIINIEPLEKRNILINVSTKDSKNILQKSDTKLIEKPSDSLEAKVENLLKMYQVDALWDEYDDICDKYRLVLFDKANKESEKRKSQIRNNEISLSLDNNYERDMTSISSDYTSKLNKLKSKLERYERVYKMILECEKIAKGEDYLKCDFTSYVYRTICLFNYLNDTNKALFINHFLHKIDVEKDLIRKQLLSDNKSVECIDYDSWEWQFTLLLLNFIKEFTEYYKIEQTEECIELMGFSSNIISEGWYRSIDRYLKNIDKLIIEIKKIANNDSYYIDQLADYENIKINNNKTLSENHDYIYKKYMDVLRLYVKVKREVSYIEAPKEKYREKISNKI